jgi:hypothetical protein
LLQETLTVPNTVKVMGQFCCYQLRKCDIIFESPCRLERIEALCFRATAIESIAIPRTVKEMHNRAFYRSRALINLRFEPHSRLKVSETATFISCPVLTRIVIPRRVEVIQSHAFAGCSKLADVTFERQSRLKKIDDCAFMNDVALLSILIPLGVTDIGDSAFRRLASSHGAIARKVVALPIRNHRPRDCLGRQRDGTDGLD